MKKPIFSEIQRHSLIIPEIEIAKLKIKRELEKSKLGQLIKICVEQLVKLLSA